MIRDKTLRRILRDAGLTTSASMIGAVLNLARSALLARYLGVTDFGRMAIVISSTVLVRQLISIRAWEWTTVELSRAYTDKDPDRAGAMMKASYLLNAVVALVAFLVIQLLAAWFSDVLVPDADLERLLQINAILVLTNWADDSSYAALRVIGRFRWLAGYNVVAALVRFAAIIPAMLLGFDVGDLLVVTIAASGVCSLWLFFAARRFLEQAFGRPLGGRLRDILTGWRRHVRMLIILSTTDTVKTLTSDADVVVIGHFHDAATVAPYRAAFQVVSGVHQLATPLYMVFYPEMTKIAASRDAAALRRLARQTAIFGALVAIVVGGSLALSAGFIARALFGAEFAGAATDLRIMSLSLLILTVQWANPLFVSLGRPGHTLVMVLAGLIVKLALLLALVPGMGHAGAAIAYAGSMVVFVPVAIGLARLSMPLLEQMSAERRASERK